MLHKEIYLFFAFLTEPNVFSLSHLVTDADSCSSVAKKFGISESQFYALNPGLHHAGEHLCDNLDTGKQYCVKAPKGKRAFARRTTPSSIVDNTTKSTDLSGVQSKLSGVLSKLKGLDVSDLSSKEADAVSNVQSKVQSVLTLVTSTTTPVLSTVQSKVQNVLTLVQGLNLPVLSSVETQLQSTVSTVQTLISSTVGSTGDLSDLKSALTGVQSKLSGLTSVLSNAGVPVSSLQSKVTSLLSELKGSAPDLSNVQTEVQGLLSKLQGLSLPELGPVTNQLSGVTNLLQNILPVNNLGL